MTQQSNQLQELRTQLDTILQSVQGYIDNEDVLAEVRLPAIDQLLELFNEREKRVIEAINLLAKDMAGWDIDTILEDEKIRPYDALTDIIGKSKEYVMKEMFPLITVKDDNQEAELLVNKGERDE